MCCHRNQRDQIGDRFFALRFLLGDDANVDLDEDETELKPSLSTDDDRR
jgi:hypothetical protein